MELTRGLSPRDLRENMLTPLHSGFQLPRIFWCLRFVNNFLIVWKICLHSSLFSFSWFFPPSFLQLKGHFVSEVHLENVARFLVCDTSAFGEGRAIFRSSWFLKNWDIWPAQGKKAPSWFGGGVSREFARICFESNFPDFSKKKDFGEIPVCGNGSRTIFFRKFYSYQPNLFTSTATKTSCSSATTSVSQSGSTSGTSRPHCWDFTTSLTAGSSCTSMAKTAPPWTSVSSSEPPLHRCDGFRHRPQDTSTLGSLHSTT